jgi:hypothetical protein
LTYVLFAEHARDDQLEWVLSEVYLTFLIHYHLVYGDEILAPQPNLLVLHDFQLQLGTLIVLLCLIQVLLVLVEETSQAVGLRELQVVEVGSYYPSQLDIGCIIDVGLQDSDSLRF